MQNFEVIPPSDSSPQFENSPNVAGSDASESIVTSISDQQTFDVEESKENFPSIVEYNELNEAKDSDSRNSIKEEKNNRRKVRFEKLGKGIPILQPKLLQGEITDIDLATDEDKRDLEMEAFLAKIEKKLPKQKKLSMRSSPPKGHNPHGILRYQKFKESLSASLSTKRRIEQDKRKELYLADNEMVLDNEDEMSDYFEEDEETAEDKEKKKKEKRERVLASLNDDCDDDSNSNDESYHGEDEDEQEDGKDDHESKSDIDEASTSDEERSVADGKNQSRMSGNENDEDSSSASVVPASLSQWFGKDSKTSEVDTYENSGVFVVEGLENTVSQAPSSSQDEELMMLCSGVFPPTPPSGASRNVLPREPQFARIESDSDDDEGNKHPHDLSVRKKKNISDSDDEDDNSLKLNEQQEMGEFAAIIHEVKENLETGILDDSKCVDAVKGTSCSDGHDRSDDYKHLKITPRIRAVLDDSDDECEQINDKLAEEKESIQDIDEDDGEEEEEPNYEEEPIATPPASDNDDSDDEVAVYKRLEHRQMLKKQGFIDDQADLSGDDVGSEDEDENEEADYYEAELGDEEAIDMDKVRRENHKLMLKQQNDDDHRNIVRMQNELLADGDLGGSDTDRRFRFTIREEVEVDLLVDGEVGDNMEEEEEGDEQTAKERLEALKYKMQMQMDDEDSIAAPDSSDALSSAFNLVSKVVLKTTSKPRSIPSLLGREGVSLSTTSKENNVGGVKRLFVQTVKESTESMPQKSNPVIRPLCAAKRPSDTENTAKRHKHSVFNSLS